MDVEPASTSGRMHLTLGPVERRIVGISASIIVATLGWFALTVLTTKETVQRAATQESVTEIAKQQAVMTARLSDLTTQLSDVPTMKTEIAQLKVQVEQNRRDLEEQRRLGRVR